jgi:acetyltransferase EpsM
MKKVSVWGSSTIIAPIIDLLPDLELVEVLNDNIPVGQTEGRFHEQKITGTSEKIPELLKDKDMYFVFTAMTMKNKRAVWDKAMSFRIPRERFINIIHPTAIIPGGYCNVGYGVVMAPLVQLSPDVLISDNCILYANSFVGHGSTLERYVVVANNASIGGNVIVGRGVHIGSNASIREGVTIGEFSIVGMGSVVLKDVPPNTIVAGNPAKKIGEVGQ